jgi:23S rRNA (guanosine2251-2'-O)-methyltransferase
MTERLVWIWGRHPVLEAIRAGNARAVLVAAGRRPAPVLQAIHSAATEHGIAVREVPLPEIERLAPGQTTQGVAAQIVEHRVSAFGELLQTLESAPGPPFLLALDQIQDPQ